MTAEPNERVFVKRLQELLVSLPYDLKALFEAVSDGNLPENARRIAAGAAIYCLSPSDPIPDSLGLVGYVDDVVIVRLALKRLMEVAGEDGASYPERFPDQFGPLDEDIRLMEAFLGDSWGWLKDRLDKHLLRSRYKGKDAAAYAADEAAGEFLYEQWKDFTTGYDIDDEAAAKLQSIKPVREVFNKRKVEESKRIG